MHGTTYVCDICYFSVDKYCPLFCCQRKHNFPGNATIVPASLVVSSQIQGFKNPSVSKADEKVQIDFDLKVCKPDIRTHILYMCSD